MNVSPAMRLFISRPFTSSSVLANEPTNPRLLSTAKVFNGAGEFTALSGDSAGKTITGAKVAGTGDDLKLTIDYNTTAAGAYPIVLVTYESACDKGNPADKLALLKSFLTYTSSTAAQSSVSSIGYAPLPDEVRTKVATVVSNLG